MKIGDQVRFLNETGGGRVAGFQGKNIVLVEDEDGFQVPMLTTEVVVVNDSNYYLRYVYMTSENDFFEQPALIYTLIENDVQKIKL